MQRLREDVFSKENPGPKERGSPKMQSQGSELLRLQPLLAPLEVPASGVAAATTSRVHQDRVDSSGGCFNAAPAAAAAAAAVAPHSVSRKRPRKTQQHVGVSDCSGSPRRLPSPPPRPSIFRVEEASSALGKPPIFSVDGSKVGGYHEQGSMRRGVQSLRLPALEERYGVSVKESWVPSPVALRLGRPRCKSVDIAHLDQLAYKRYMEGVLRAGAVESRKRRQELTHTERNCCKEQGVMIDEVGEGNGSDLGTKQERRTAADPSFGVSCDCLPIQEDGYKDGRSGSDEGDSAHDVPCCSLRSSTLAPGGDRKRALGGPSSTGRGATATTTATTAVLMKSDHHHRVDKDHSCVGFGASSSQDPVASASIPLSQLRGAGACVFRLTSCDIEEPQRIAANGGGGRGPGKLHREPLPKNSSSTTATADETLASEELGFRSKGARKVFKQTQRLLEALRTPASSCQVTSTGSRRRCGGAIFGGDSSLVIHPNHHNLGHRPAATAGVGGHKKSRGSGNDFSGYGGNGGGSGSDTDTGMWRIPQGNKPARLAEVFRCVAPPHTVSIESEIILYDSLRRVSAGRDGDGGAGEGGGGPWDDLVDAWEVSTGRGVGRRRHPRISCSKQGGSGWHRYFRRHPSQETHTRVSLSQNFAPPKAVHQKRKNTHS